jgi:hypothetical protein
MERAPFRVDLTDPVDIKAKLADGRRILREIEDQLASLDRLQRESREWRANVDFLASKIGATEPDAVAQTGSGTTVVEAKGGERPGTLQLVVEVINREIRKLRAIEVHAILAREGHDLNADQVRNALHYAAHKANPPLIQAPPGRGMYAPLTYREVELPAANGDEPAGGGSPHVRWYGGTAVGTAGGALPGR